MARCGRPGTVLDVPTLPRETELYRALRARDPSYDGLFYFAVQTTGVFCRPICPARTPRRENVRFFTSAAEAEHAGFRACKRCRPLDPRGASPAWVEALVAAVERRARAGGRRLRDEELRASGVEPTTARRYFQEQFGMTFHAYQRTLWLEKAQSGLAAGGAVSDVALDAGFESESGFRAAFVRLFGEPPSRAHHQEVLSVAHLASPIGSLFGAATSERVCMLEFVERKSIEGQVQALKRHFDGPILPGTNDLLERLRSQLAEYFAGARTRFDLPLAVVGTPFQEAVWHELARIPYGETRSYEDVARAIGRPTACRAVGMANGRNRLAILLPCHRVVEKSGALRGYAGGLWRKQRLLDLERASLPDGAGRQARPSDTPSRA